MADLATLTDVEDSWRSLRGQEIVVAQTWIAAAQAQLRSDIVGLDAWAASDPEHAIVVREKIIQAVLRRLDGSWTSPWPFSRDEIDRLILMVAGSVSGSGLPVGAFPDLVEYPVY